MLVLERPFQLYLKQKVLVFSFKDVFKRILMFEYTSWMVVGIGI